MRNKAKQVEEKKVTEQQIATTNSKPVWLYEPRHNKISQASRGGLQQISLTRKLIFILPYEVYRLYFGLDPALRLRTRWPWSSLINSVSVFSSVKCLKSTLFAGVCEGGLNYSPLKSIMSLKHLAHSKTSISGRYYYLVGNETVYLEIF